MVIDLSPEAIAKKLKKWDKRAEPFRASRYAFLRSYAGNKYNIDKWGVGEEPLNLIFNAIRVLVPNLVMKYPKAIVTSNLLDQRDYAEMMAMALDYLARRINLKTTLRRWVVDALFMIGIVKCGLCTRETLLDDTNETDPKLVLTQPYVDTVDFDDWILDPDCRRREEAGFAGNYFLVNRDLLLESELYNNELVERLPSALDMVHDNEEARQLSQATGRALDSEELQQIVRIAELWVPSENAIITVPTPDGPVDSQLREPQEAYCVEEGPLVYLALAPEVPDNPIPVAPVGIWYDLATQANETMAKILEQAGAQKTVVGYKPGVDDDAEALVQAKNLESVCMEDPSAVQVFNIGGQDPKNEQMLSNLMMLFSQMAGNIEQLAGNRSDADSATQASILQQNAMVTIEDMRDLVYDGTAEIYRRMGYYLHTDPLIDIPLVHRQDNPETGEPEDVQIHLTPEVRRGEFFDYAFIIKLRSMSRMDAATRLKRMMEFYTNVVPATVMAGLQMLQAGVPFDIKRALVQAAQELDLEWMDQTFGDERVLNKYIAMTQLGPKAEDSKGQPVAKTQSPAGVLQNNGSPVARPMLSVGTEQRQDAQAGAADAQSLIQGV